VKKCGTSREATDYDYDDNDDDNNNKAQALYMPDKYGKKANTFK
jgi:hypothetical protein